MTGEDGGHGATKPEARVENLIQSRISELEDTITRDVAEEREIADRVRAEQKRMANLVNAADSEIDKLNLLQRRYTALFQDMQRLEHDYARSRLGEASLRKDREVAAADLQKSNAIKQKLEALCRELQKENKRVKDDSKRLAVIEQEKRIELNNKFETTIFEIKSKMDAEHNDLGRRRVADVELREKFKSFLEQYDVRETHYQQTLSAKDLQIQLLETRNERCQRTLQLEADRSKLLHVQVSTFSETESELRSQLNIYVDKFRQVEDTLNNSNDLFLNFRREMETMTKKTKKLERENGLIRAKCDAANLNILEMVEERQRNRREIEALQQRSAKLEGICRALQSRRLDSASHTGDPSQQLSSDDSDPSSSWNMQERDVMKLGDARLNPTGGSAVQDSHRPSSGSASDRSKSQHSPSTLMSPTQAESNTRRLVPLEEKLMRFVRREIAVVPPRASNSNAVSGSLVGTTESQARDNGDIGAGHYSDRDLLEKSRQVFHVLRDSLDLSSTSAELNSALHKDVEQALNMLECNMDAEALFGSMTRTECDQIFAQLSSVLSAAQTSRGGLSATRAVTSRPR